MDRKVRRVRIRFIALGMVGALGVAAGSSAVAQVATPALTVRPREMATGTKNPAAGEYPLDSVPTAIVSVPPQCAGARRCPLLVALPGGGQPASAMTGWLRPVADRYGFILLATPGIYKPTHIDAMLKEVLQRFAIDPEKIAISGRCASGPAAMVLGVSNLHVFSRIALISGVGSQTTTTGMDPQNKTTEFLIDAGYSESTSAFRLVSELRRNGHPVRHTVTLRGHEHQAEDYDFLGRWLHESWTQPDPAKRKEPAVIEPLPVLTPEAISQMTTFWATFSQEPESRRGVAARLPFIRDVVVPVGAERPIVPMVDMAALSAKHRSVAAALKKAGLTAQQHDAYRVALVSAMITKGAAGQVGPIEEGSTLAKNTAFLAEHPDELNALADAGIQEPSKLNAINGCCTSPKGVEQMGPLGIWRTP